MKTPIIQQVKICPAAIFLCLCATLLCALPHHAWAQVRIIDGRPVMPDNPGGMPSGMDTSSKSDSSGKDSDRPWLPSEPALLSATSTNLDGSKTNADEIQLSFQGANIDIVIQWLA